MRPRGSCSPIGQRGGPETEFIRRTLWMTSGERMTHPQLLAFAILAAMMGLFVWGRLRYDLVAVLALLASVAAGTVPAASLFTALPAGGTTAPTVAGFDWSPATGSPIATGGLSAFTADPKIAARACGSQ